MARVDACLPPLPPTPRRMEVWRHRTSGKAVRVRRVAFDQDTRLQVVWEVEDLVRGTRAMGRTPHEDWKDLFTLVSSPRRLELTF